MKIGVSELILIFIVALIFIGPDKLPQFAARLGKAVAKFKEASSEATGEIKKSVVEPLNEASKPLREAMEPLEDLDRQVKSNVNEVKRSFDGIGKPEKKKPEENVTEKRETAEVVNDNKAEAADGIKSHEDVNPEAVIETEKREGIRTEDAAENSTTDAGGGTDNSESAETKLNPRTEEDSDAVKEPAGAAQAV